MGTTRVYGGGTFHEMVLYSTEPTGTSGSIAAMTLTV